MTFNSYEFILLFFPAFMILYYSVGRINIGVSKVLIVLGGIVFYLYAGWETSAILGASIVVNYAMVCLLKRVNKKRPMLAITIILNIGLLLYFKYMNFAIDIANGFTAMNMPHRDLILPLGISFFTFQQIMYAVSVSRDEVGIQVIDYLAYTLYFPKLVMGPLMEPSDFFDQLKSPTRNRINWENITSGIKVFSFGLFKKMLLADTFAKAVDWGFKNGVTAATATPTATAGDLFLVMLFYTFQIYFDFSGYSDMAVGISKMINIDLPMNFDSPYKATSIRDFWKRWHMSLTNFLTKYVYFPLGGSKKGKIRTYINIVIVFLVSGIWHGANWTFILWGALHGLLQVIERIFKKSIDKLSDVVRWIYTFFSVNILWLLFRADSIGDWCEMLRTMFCFQDMSVSEGLIKTFTLPESNFILEKLHLVQTNTAVRGFSMLVFIIVSYLICLIPENNYRSIKKINAVNMILCAIAFVWGFLCLSSESVFVYFNF